MGTGRHADRLLTVLVDDNVEASDEVLAVVEVERAPKASLVVEQLEFVLPALELVWRQPAPPFADLKDRQRREPPVRQETTKGERHGPAWRLVEDE